MLWNSPETVMALHKAKVDDERRRRVGRVQSKKAKAPVAPTVRLRPLAAS